MVSLFKTNTNNLNTAKVYRAGFGLVELLVSVGIMVLVTAVILIDFGNFNNSNLLRNQAFEVALTVREAQFLAVSTVGSGTNFRNSFGVHFVADERSYITFQDQDDDQRYDVGDTTEFVSSQSVDPRFVVRDIIAMPSGTALGDVSITFLRPNFDARFESAGTTAVPNGTTEIVIGLAIVGSGTDSGPEVYREVIISTTGQIEVQ